MLERLIGKGRDVRVFDPHIELESIYGSNCNFIEHVIPHIGRLMHKSLDETLAWADHLVITQKQNGAAAEAIRARGLLVVDFVNVTVKTAGYAATPA